MLFVVDFNVVFSGSVTKGKCFEVFRRNSELKKFEFISPAFVLSELDDHLDEVYSLTKLTKEQLDKSLELIKSQIRPIAFSEFSDRFAEALTLNKKDSPYLALALKRKCPIFSGDKKLELQSKVKIFFPADLLDMLEELDKSKGESKKESISELNKLMERVSDEDSTELIRKMRDKKYD